MKKIILAFSTFVLFLPIFNIFLFACSFNFLNIDLANLSDYNWKKEEPNFPGYQSVSLRDKVITNSGDLSYVNNQRYLDYKNFNTGFKNLDAIKKQAVTGVPMNSAFNPNGNYLKDFGESQKSLMFQQVNSILDWDPNIDHDAKYNQGDYSYIQSKKVANKWVNSQDANVQTQILGLGVKATSAMNSVVGSNRIFNLNFNNWQYSDRFVAWAGAESEGIIVPPAADEINAAHVNGTKIYGQVFLDGYHGLTKAMLRDFLKRDDSGNFQIVDVLINMSKYMGFDGWFWNNEPNGSWQNGLIMDNQMSVEIINQFNKKVQESTDSEIKHLELLLYKDHGILGYYENGQPIDTWANKLAEVNHGQFLQDFYSYPNDSNKWSQNHQQFNSFDIYNMYNLGGWVNGEIFYNEKRIGTRDIRELTQRHLDQNGREYQNLGKELTDRDNNKWTFDGRNQNSLSIFQATTAFDLAGIYLDRLGHQPTISDDVFATMYANYYDDMIYTGQHRYLTNQDKGTTSWDSDFSIKDLSYGVGNLVQENTILFDDASGVDNVSNFKTNFSTGQGQIFVSDDGSVVKNYPWNNRRLFDTQPTYKWNIETASNKMPSSDVFGFYDYYQPYRKGNSIALGSGFDDKGKVLPFGLKEKINWNIMGTNYNKANKKVNFKYKMTDEKDNWENLSDSIGVKILVTFADGSTKEIGVEEVPDVNGWVTISSDLSTIGELSNKIAKLGLSINPLKADAPKIKFNVGEMTVNFNENKQDQLENQTYITDLTSENAVTRGNKTSLRLNWNVDSSLHEQIAYYEIYIQKAFGDTLFVGQTVNNNYYLKNLLISNNDKIIIKTINKYNSENSSFQSWNLKN
ncbi:endo-beta-N-acetylglucosaminidase [Spiroplasma platyhelix]|uniref:Cytosolic endo-beta-N-acetylglucosaminidase TIM barrel domain-containing protein n=1 Tax=Spiroplasma platyhelix PALS-1 TaxID=1276218 RepID=A0A846TWV8_9MOLU|nr:hypothetical protein [Spiroplasma platyhelix]MBE4704160.1 hypothetical protein [Spiroplasma platyhelix PALS-1]NKE38531.1 hypothetical protein [Spiroplasma platyhelix PALS-1]UJB29418.1 endo-beta-N-acetylglucosaminidase [Spiroplasma platyhelix PALS-1]